MSWKGDCWLLQKGLLQQLQGCSHGGIRGEHSLLSSFPSLYFEFVIHYPAGKKVQIGIQTHLHVLLVKHLKI